MKFKVINKKVRENYVILNILNEKNYMNNTMQYYSGCGE